MPQRLHPASGIELTARATRVSARAADIRLPGTYARQTNARPARNAEARNRNSAPLGCAGKALIQRPLHAARESGATGERIG